MNNKYEKGGHMYIHQKIVTTGLVIVSKGTIYRHRGGDSDCCGVIDRLNDEARLGGRVVLRDIVGDDDGETMTAGDDDRDSVRAMDVLV